MSGIQNKIRIGQITDIHLHQHLPGPASIGNRRSRQMPELFQKAAEHLIQEKIDVLVLTGDIIDVPRWTWKDGFYYDYPLDWWHQQIEREYLEFKTFLSTLPFPVICLPGNHDHPFYFRKIFGVSTGPIPIKGFHFYSFHDWPIRGSAGRRIHHERQLMDKALSEDPNLQIHLQHYVIAPHIHHEYPYNFAEQSELKKRILDSKRVSLVLSGHYHRGASEKCVAPNGFCTYFETGKAFCEIPHPYRIYEINSGEVNFQEFQISSESIYQGRGVFLDRDGVLTTRPSFYGGPNEIELFKGAAQAVKEIHAMGYASIVISNQTSIGYGYTTRETVDWTMDEMHRQLAKGGAHLDGVFFSRSAGPKGVLAEFQNFKNVKPAPDLILEALTSHTLDPVKCCFVGDRATDVRCARNAGVRPVLVKTGFGRQALEELTPEEISGRGNFKNTQELIQIESICEVPVILKSLTP